YTRPKPHQLGRALDPVQARRSLARAAVIRSLDRVGCGTRSSSSYIEDESMWELDDIATTMSIRLPIAPIIVCGTKMVNVEDGGYESAFTRWSTVHGTESPPVEAIAEAF